jgi:hypothetical protein
MIRMHQKRLDCLRHTERSSFKWTTFALQHPTYLFGKLFALPAVHCCYHRKDDHICSFSSSRRCTCSKLLHPVVLHGTCTKCMWYFKAKTRTSSRYLVYVANTGVLLCFSNQGAAAVVAVVVLALCCCLSDAKMLPTLFFHVCKRPCRTFHCSKSNRRKTQRSTITFCAN